jgi:uncharacterized lipoprotein YajG
MQLLLQFNKGIVMKSLLLILGSIFIIGCGTDPQPQVIIKKVYVKQKCPKLQTIEFNDTDTGILKINVKKVNK